MGNQLNQGAIRRLARYQARLEGAQMALQAVDSVVKNLTENYTEALRSACEDAEIEMPPPGVQAQVNIDWVSGNVTIVPVVLEVGNGSIESAN